MTKQQNNKRAMLESVVSLIETNAARTSSIQELVASAGRLRSLVDSMHDKTSEVIQASAGKAAAKMEARNQLRAALSAVKAGLYAYAAKQGDAELKAKANIPNRIVRDGRDTDLIASADMILKLARQIGPVLDPHGITEEKRNNFKASLRGFEAQLGDVKGTVAVRVAARQALDELIAEADGILVDELDRYFEVLQESDREIVNAYFQARFIGKPGYRHQVAEQASVPQLADVKKAA